MKKLTTIVLGAALLLGSTALAAEKGNYTPPQLSRDEKTVFFNDDTYNHDKTGRLMDADRDGDKETRCIKFVNSQGQQIIQWEAGEKTWGWSIKDNPKDKTDDINNYTIVDVEGNNQFTMKYGRTEEFDPPKYI